MGTNNMRSDYSLQTIANKDGRCHSRRTDACSFHRICFFCVMLIMACFFLACQRAYSQQPWPSIHDFISSGHGSRPVADFKLSKQELSELQRITAKWTERH